MNEEVNEDNQTIEEWAAANRVIFILSGSQIMFAGLWKVVVDFDGEKMLLTGTPDWPQSTYDHVEVHYILPAERPDRYDEENKVSAFKSVMPIRPVTDEPKTVHEDGKTFIRFSEKPRITELHLSKPFSVSKPF